MAGQRVPQHPPPEQPIGQYHIQIRQASAADLPHSVLFFGLMENMMLGNGISLQASEMSSAPFLALQTIGIAHPLSSCYIRK